MDSDEALYDRLRAGDLAAFDRLYERYERRLFGFIRTQLRDVHEAEDVFHETFLAILDTRPDIRSFKAWLFQVARNICLNRVRSRQRAERALETAAALVAPPDDNPMPRADDPSLRAAVARLPPGLAEVYQLRASGMSYDELADVLEIPVGTVKSRMHEMMRRLREVMSHDL
jgi:RNA polymerase sigma-70 factor (ECF subfamily)